MDQDTPVKNNREGIKRFPVLFGLDYVHRHEKSINKLREATGQPHIRKVKVRDEVKGLEGAMAVLCS